MIQPDYTRIQQLLSREHSMADAAEAHGTLAGCLCGASGYRFEDWLREILPEGRADRAARAPLQELFGWTASALLQPDMEFELLLPADSESLTLRTQALAEWCQGFLYGLGAGSIPDAKALPGEVGEVVRDFIEITRAEVDEGQDADSNEGAYAELVEFVRVSVQFVFEELEPLRDEPTPPGASLH